MTSCNKGTAFFHMIYKWISRVWEQFFELSVSHYKTCNKILKINFRKPISLLYILIFVIRKTFLKLFTWEQFPWFAFDSTKNRFVEIWLKKLPQRPLLLKYEPFLETKKIWYYALLLIAVSFPVSNNKEDMENLRTNSITQSIRVRRVIFHVVTFPIQLV